jgi:hypothetical protein
MGLQPRLFGRETETAQRRFILSCGLCSAVSLFSSFAAQFLLSSWARASWRSHG